jgi:hypothetical protein
MKPVCWYGSDMDEFYTPEMYEEFAADGVADGLVPLYAAPREWVGLTDMEREEIVSKKWWDWEDAFDIEGFSKAIEDKLKEKNT